jgi:hypothetical protein
MPSRHNRYPRRAPSASTDLPVVEQMAGSMRRALLFACVCLLVNSARAEDPYRFFDWDVTYGEISPLGVSQQVQEESLVLSVQYAFIQFKCNLLSYGTGNIVLRFLFCILKSEN